MEKNYSNPYEEVMKRQSRAIRRKEIVDIATKMGKLGTYHILAVVLTC